MNKKWTSHLSVIKDATSNYVPCIEGKCSCHYAQIQADLKIFKSGVNKNTIEASKSLYVKVFKNFV